MKLKFIILIIAIITITHCTGNTKTIVNSVLGDISFIKKFGYAPTEDTGEKIRIQTHLEYVENLLRQKNCRNLALELQEKREILLDMLHSYWIEAKFPANYDYPKERAPCFIDKKGNICAVGYLIEETTSRQLAEQINAQHQYDRIYDMKMPELFSWIKNSGLTVEECAMIQPTYGDQNKYIVKDSLGRIISMKYYDFTHIQLQDEENIQYKPLNDSISIFNFTYKYNGKEFLNEILISREDQKNSMYGSIEDYHNYYYYYDNYYDRSDLPYFRKYRIFRNILFSKNVAKIKYEYNTTSGRLIGISYLDIENKPTLVNGYHHVTEKYDYDNKNRLIQISYWDTKNKLALYKDGLSTYAIVQINYDNNNNVIEKKFYDTSEKLTLGSSFSYGMLYEISPHNTSLQMHSDKRHVLTNSNNIAIFQWQYDNNNNLLEEKYYDFMNKPIANKSNKAGYKFKHNTNCNLIEVSSYGIDGNITNFRINQKYRYATIKYKYDSFNRMIERGYYNVENDLVCISENMYQKMAKETWEYDNNNNLLEHALYNTQNQKYSRKYKYDDKNRKIEEGEYGFNDKLIQITNDPPLEKYRYDSDGHLIEISYFSTYQNPMLSTTCDCASKKTIYDYQKRSITENYYDIESNLIKSTKLNIRF